MERLDLPEYAEDAAILRFYHLDSLDSDVWIDDGVVSDNNQETEKESSIRQFQHPEQEDTVNSISIPPPENDIDLQIIDDSDPLGVYRSIFPDGPSRNTNISQLKEKTTIMIANKKFQPRQFLLQVHKNTSYNDLVAGEDRLRRGVDQRAEALKNLVHQNFDRFVSAKNTIDHVYEEMKSKQLNQQQEYGTIGIQAALNDANNRAEQVYGPVVERRQRVEKVKNTLYVLQRYKFLFNLPSNLLESIKQNKYEAAIRDYKKGKYLYQVLKGDLGTTDRTSGLGEIEKEKGLTELHHKVFDKVWEEVNKIVAELQTILLKMLADPWRSMEDQEKTIDFLFDLDTTEDPAWFYLDSQYQWIMGLMKETYDACVAKINSLNQENSHVEESIVKRSLSLKKAIGQIQKKITDFNTESTHELKIWQAILDLVKSLSSLLLRCLPDFWRLSTAFIEGKFTNKSVVSISGSGNTNNTTSPTTPSSRRRRHGMDMAKVEQCQRMTQEIIGRYASLISDYFSLNQRHLQMKKNMDGSETYSMPSFVPINTNSIYTSEYLTLIISDLANCVNDINSIHLAGEAFSGLSELIEKTRSKFIDVACKCWERDAKHFYMLEEWILDSQNPRITTLLKRYYDYHKFCARSAYKIASLSAIPDNINEQEKQLIAPNYIEKVRESFLESMYTFLDGLVQLALANYTPLNEKEEILLAKKRDKIDVDSVDIRILLTVSNLEHMRASVIRKLISLFEAAYNIQMNEDLHTLIDVIDRLDQILFGDYIKRKSQKIRDIIRQGILMSGIDWSSIPKPQEVHPFVYEALMVLVMVHSQISSIAKQLIPRALSKLLENMATDCLDSFRQVERFGMGGMLQATLEIEFMHQTLSQYVTPAASNTLQSIYQTIEQAYDPQQQQSANLQSELSHVKELLVFSRISVSRPFYYGSIATPLNGKKVAESDHTHKWTVMVKGLNNEDLSYYIKKVVFKLHETYPNPLRTVEHPPYEISETGWGEFEIMIKIYFQPAASEKPVVLYHHLRLHPYEDDLNGQPWPKDKPVMSLLYDEFVFNEPTESLYQLFSEHNALSLNLPNKKSIKDPLMPLFSVQLEQEEIERLDKAQQEINSQIATLKQKLASFD
ncbi:exocyst complex component Sec5-domain-containing protein [Cokeromyces recurvatus]|uniref:exocyst complex component Sec5-domain-containing protein n=1 Tax=Cokeromyces recurvatus TaxID=90255 RepID=UPI002220486C|nr:exocyst complex component Sec5-domain-containing protein [Cokeromyces recurvatus]KAI7903981.1 exocyst complex component Sec5-domain-containing protein [Cokeromyces recurvatus]